MKKDWCKNHLIYIFIIAFTLISPTAFGQSSLLRNAENVYRANKFEEALELYQKAIKQYPRDSKVNHRLGVCYFETRTNLDKAKKHLKTAVSRGIRLSNLYLGKVCFLTYDFEDAENYFTKYKNYLRRNDDRIPEINESIKKCQKGANWLKRIEDITILEETDVSAHEFFKSIPMSREAGSFVYPDDILPVKTDTLIAGFLTERQDRFVFPAVKDGHTDLFDTDKLLDSWSTPQRLSENINTNSSEIYPFLSTDGITMYFASKGHDGLGDYDLFITRFNGATKSFLPPQNLGFPFSSPFNDYIYIVDEFSNTGWFVSDRKCKKDTVTIYKFKPNRYKQLVESEDKETLKKRAGLLYAWESLEDTTLTAEGDTVNTIPNSLTDTNNTEQPSTQNKAIRFVINDTMVYTELNQFTSKAAREAWLKYNQAVIQNEEANTTLKKMRAEFAEEKDPQQRNAIATKVIGLENEMFSRASTISELKIETRRLEIESIKTLLKEHKFKHPKKVRPTGTEKETLSPNKTEVASWQQEPLKIETPDTIYPAFQSAELQKNFTQIFNKAEIADLAKAEAKNLKANNLIMHMEELLMKINMPGDLEKDNRSLWEKIMHLDTTFTPSLTRKELMIKARATQMDGLRQFIDVNNHRFEVLKFKANALAHDSNNKEAQQRVSSIINNADFYKNDANKYVKDNYVDIGYGAQQLGLAANLLKKACLKAENGVLVGYKAFSSKDVVSASEDETLVKKDTVTEKDIIQTEAPKTTEHEITYRVQVGIFSKKLTTDKEQLLEDVFTIKVPEKQLLKYYSGNYKSKSDAEKAAAELANKGFKGAFIVPFKNETPISWDEVKLQKK